MLFIVFATAGQFHPFPRPFDGLISIVLYGGKIK